MKNDLVNDLFYGAPQCGMWNRKSSSIKSSPPMVYLLVTAVATWCVLLTHCIRKQMEAASLSDQETCRDRKKYIWRTRRGRVWVGFAIYTVFMLIAAYSIYYHYKNCALGAGVVKWTVLLYVLGLIPCFAGEHDKHDDNKDDDGDPSACQPLPSVHVVHIGAIIVPILGALGAMGAWYFAMRTGGGGVSPMAFDGDRGYQSAGAAARGDGVIIHQG